MKKLSEFLQDHTGAVSSKRVFSLILIFLVCMLIGRYVFTGVGDSVMIDLVKVLLSAIGAFLGITMFDRFAKDKQ
jgi:positive regulator of sigma E activity